MRRGDEPVLDPCCDEEIGGRDGGVWLIAPTVRTVAVRNKDCANIPQRVETAVDIQKRYVPIVCVIDLNPRLDLLSDVEAVIHTGSK